MSVRPELVFQIGIRAFHGPLYPWVVQVDIIAEILFHRCDHLIKARERQVIMSGLSWPLKLLCRNLC